MDQFLDQRLIDLQPAGGVEDQCVEPLRPGGVQGLARDPEHIGFAVLDEHRDVELFAQRGELIHGGRTIHVGGHQQRLPALLAEQAGELAAGGGLA